jgi:hypothetical protein
MSKGQFETQIEDLEVSKGAHILKSDNNFLSVESPSLQSFNTANVIPMSANSAGQFLERNRGLKEPLISYDQTFSSFKNEQSTQTILQDDGT